MKKAFPLITVVSIVASHPFVGEMEVVSLARHLFQKMIHPHELPPRSAELRAKILKQIPELSGNARLQQWIESISDTPTARRQRIKLNKMFAWLNYDVLTEHRLRHGIDPGMVMIEADPNPIPIVSKESRRPFAGTAA